MGDQFNSHRNGRNEHSNEHNLDMWKSSRNTMSVSNIPESQTMAGFVEHGQCPTPSHAGMFQNRMFSVRNYDNSLPNSNISMSGAEKVNYTGNNAIPNGAGTFTSINIPGYGMMAGTVHKNPHGNNFFLTENPDGSPLCFAIHTTDQKTVSFINVNKLTKMPALQLQYQMEMAEAQIPQKHPINAASTETGKQLPKLESLLRPQHTLPQMSGAANFSSNSLTQHNVMSNSIFSNGMNHMPHMSHFNNPNMLGMIRTFSSSSCNNTYIPRPPTMMSPHLSLYSGPSQQLYGLPSFGGAGGGPFAGVSTTPNDSFRSMRVNANDSKVEKKPDLITVNTPSISSAKEKSPSTRESSSRKEFRPKFDSNQPGWTEFFFCFKKQKGHKIKGGEAKIVKIAQKKWLALDDADKKMFAVKAMKTANTPKNGFVKSHNCANINCKQPAVETFERGPFYCGDSCMISHCERVFGEFVTNNQKTSNK